MNKTGLALSAVIAVLLIEPVRSMPRSQPAFPHDSQLLEKLHGARFSEIGTALEDKLSLAAVLQGFNHYGCKVRGGSANIASLPRYMSYWNDDPQAQLALALVKLHPLWLGTAQTTSARGGCQSAWAQTTMRNLFALLDERTRPGSAPPRSAPKSAVPSAAPAGPRLMKAFPLTFDQAFMHVFRRQSRGRGNPGTAETLRTQVSAIPGHWPVLRCLYAIDGGFISTGYWHTNKPPALTDALEASLPAGHPVFGIGPPRAACPAEPERQYEVLT